MTHTHSFLCKRERRKAHNAPFGLEWLLGSCNRHCQGLGIASPPAVPLFVQD